MQIHGEELAGVIGLGLSLGLWLLSSWRLIFHTVWRRRDVQGDSEIPQRFRTQRQDQQEHEDRRNQWSMRSVSKWFTRRRTFHCLLWMATSCEALAYANLSGLLPFSIDQELSKKLVYIFLDILGRSVLELLAFGTVTAIWLHTAMDASPTGNLHLPPIFAFFILLLVISSASLSVVTFVIYRKDDLQTIQDLPLSRAQTLLEAISWGIHSLVVLECLIMTSRRIVSLVPRTQRRKQISLLSKAVLPMLGASLVYATRCGWLVAVYCKVSRVDRGSWPWWIGFMWCPTWITVILLLYSARKRDHISDYTLQQPLLPAHPPAEAFLAFSQYRHGDETEDSIFCLSPILHVFTRRDEPIVADEETLSTDSDLDRLPRNGTN